MPAYFLSTLASITKTDSDQILGALSRGIESDSFYDLKVLAIRSWKSQLQVIKEAAVKLQQLVPASAGWHILLEYPIPRRGKRADMILIADDVIIVGEFKVGSTKFTTEDARQVIGYCLDLRDFHEESRGQLLIPLLIATDAPNHTAGLVPPRTSALVQPLCTANASMLAETICTMVQTYRASQLHVDATRWNNSKYFPTPTIVEAAQALYARQDVREISQSHAGATNLSITSDAVVQAIHYARDNSKKVICFVTGVPGSGKTLAGLNIVHNPTLQEGGSPIGSFMSGNGPLIAVLREALARDHDNRTGTTREEARRKISAFIQNIHLYIKEYIDNHPNYAPMDRVIIFDEAQRAWDAKQNARKWRRNASEPMMILSTMDRHPDWAVIVALVGNGQEIHDGEAGLPEWGRVLSEEQKHWEVFISPELLSAANRDDKLALFQKIPENLCITTDARLHLNVSLRAYKAKQLSDWVDAVLNKAPHKANSIIADLVDYPILLTRSLETARDWLRKQTQGTRRCGLVASSGARRLRPHAIDVTIDLPVESWFLNPQEDVRSSSFLELAATEFAIQGLELDWIGVCWGDDLRWLNGQWDFHRFLGTKWQRVANETKRKFMINKYRVLLTRAREGMVIWVPEGSKEDTTRRPEFYEETAEYLLSCGAQLIR